VFSSALNYALFPRLATTTDGAERRRLGFEGLHVLAVVTSPPIAACMLCIGPFLAWWISAEMASNATVLAQLLFLGFWLNGLALVPYTQLQASGRPDLVAKCHLAELLPYLALLYFALQNWGLVGAAAVFSLRAAADFLLLAHLADSLGGALRLLAWPALLLTLVLCVATPNSLPAPWPIGLGLTLLAVLCAWSWARAPASLRRWSGGFA
jgi:O-antigen/teichoic acid export membrane protein